MVSTERVARTGGLARRVAFPQLVAGTTGLVFATVLLGVATKATGAGLACNAQWPLCDGGLLDLFPATVPSFFEWIHRVVAGVAGIAILGTAVAAWRGDAPRRVRQAVAVGAVLLPVQVLLGRETVLSYTLPVLAAHFWVAFAIFASFVVATVLTWREVLTPRRLRSGAALAAGLVPVQLLLHPPVVTSYTPTVQTLQYAVTLATFALAVAAAVGGRDHLRGRAARVAVALPLLHPPLVFAGRNLLAPSSALLAGYGLLAALFVAGLLAAAVAFHRVASSGRTTAGAVDAADG